MIEYGSTEHRAKIAAGLRAFYRTDAGKAKVARMKARKRTCSVANCDRTAKARGLCDAHYKRLARLGEVKPEMPVQITRDDVARFWSKVDATDPTVCWLWTYCLNGNGYGRFPTHAGTYAAHRFVYELTKGPIPPGMEIDHLCHTRNCVNPAHLEVVTHAENCRRQRPKGTS